jgi:hypothetical protein
MSKSFTRNDYVTRKDMFISDSMTRTNWDSQKRSISTTYMMFSILTKTTDDWTKSRNSSGYTRSQWNSIGIGEVKSKARIYGYRCSAWNEFYDYINKLM